MRMPRVSALHIYPVKSCGGINVQCARLEGRGPEFDRRFMVVDGTGRFLTQRQEPRLALVRPTLVPPALLLDAPGMRQIEVALSGGGRGRVPIQVWSHSGEAEYVGEEPAGWFSEYLGRGCRLVRWGEDEVRFCDPTYARFESQVAFADGFPVLLISEASLRDLNGRMDAAVPMDRFRPNIVVQDCEPYAEDNWKQIRIGDLLFDVVKPSSRCVTTTVDQSTGEVGKEPLKTLATYRKRGNAVFFGQNCIHHSPGMVRVGDEVRVTETA